MSIGLIEVIVQRRNHTETNRAHRLSEVRIDLVDYTVSALRSDDRGQGILLLVGIQVQLCGLGTRDIEVQQ